MNRIALSLLLALSFSLVAFSQSYDLAFGLRLGTDIGVTGQLRLPPVDENFTVEAILQSSLQREEGQFTLLGQQHFPLITRRVNVYAGGGVHAGWVTQQPDSAEEVINPLGISGVIGAELTLGRLNLSYDFKPAFNLRGGEKNVYTQTAVSVRYVAFKRHDIFESPRQKRKRKRREAREQKRRDRKNGQGNQWWKFWEKSEVWY